MHYVLSVSINVFRMHFFFPAGTISSLFWLITRPEDVAVLFFIEFNLLSITQLCNERESPL